MQFFERTPATSIIAVIIMLAGFALLFCLSFIPTHIDASAKTQIIQGDWNIMLTAALYYFGSAKQKTVTQSADNISNSPAVGDGSTTNNP